VSWDEGLDGAAREFAAADDAAVRALAGPGTGKTFALLRRTARLLEQGCPADRLLVLTFARTAAQDLVRALQGIEGWAAEEIRVGTLHSFCFSLLSRERVLAATRRTPRILLEFERNLLLLDLEGVERRCHWRRRPVHLKLVGCKRQSGTDLSRVGALILLAGLCR
jgi:ATP-dependent DNA helicase UvrD/PcrA